MIKTFAYRDMLSFHAVPYWFLVATAIVSIGLVSLFWLCMAIWLVAVLVIVAWLPLIFFKMNDVYKRYGSLAFLFVLMVTQTLHFFEHIAQFIELHFLGLKGTQANGLIGFLNTEWVHFLWNSWVLAFSVLLIFLFRKNTWLMALFIFAIYHEIEHGYIMSIYLQTNVPGNPGLLAKGGIVFGGLPITRPDLHFLYAVFQEGLLVVAYIVEIRKAISARKERAASSLNLA